MYMENTDLFYFTTLDFDTWLWLIEDDWNHHYFYFLSRYFFQLRAIEKYHFTIDSFLLAWDMAWFNTKELNTLLKKWCVIENKYLRFEINKESDIPEVILENIWLKHPLKSHNVALPIEMLEMVKTIEDFKYLCSVIQNCDGSLSSKNEVWNQ